jgi:hypothetical protein
MASIGSFRSTVLLPIRQGKYTSGSDMSLLLRLTNLYCIKFWNYEDHKNSAILDWAMAQVVESLPSQHKALSSNPSTTKKNSVIFFPIFLRILWTYPHRWYCYLRNKESFQCITNHYCIFSFPLLYIPESLKLRNDWVVKCRETGQSESDSTYFYFVS